MDLQRFGSSPGVRWGSEVVKAQLAHDSGRDAASRPDVG